MKFARIFTALFLASLSFVAPSTSRSLQVQDPPLSPRIAALQTELTKGNTAALDQFWQDIARDGAPIVETIQGEPGKVLVTFVWRGKDETRNVVLFQGPSRGDLLRNQLTRISASDVWYKTYRVPSDARFTYALSPNDSLIPFDEVPEKEFEKRISTVRVDPLNKRGAFGSGSIVELPDAPAQTWHTRTADAPHGRLDATNIKSAILNNQRRAWVYLPPGYERTAKPYPLVVMFDGPLYTVLVPTANILDNLIQKSKVPPLVAVILDNPTPTSRATELACNDRFADFIAKEVIPWVRANYNVTSDSQSTAVGGASLGGLAASFIGLRHPEIFGNIISQSGSFWWKPGGEKEHEWLTRQFVSSPKLALKFHLDIGLLEVGPTPDNGPDMVTSNRHLRDVLRAKGYDVDYHESNCGHDFLNWRGGLPEALMFLFGRQ